MSMDQVCLAAPEAQFRQGQHAEGRDRKLSLGTFGHDSACRSWQFSYGLVVLRVSACYGVLIYMYRNKRDHPFPHFHAIHAR